VWFDVFYDVKKHIIINFENGRRIYGWPVYYSNDPDKQYISRKSNLLNFFKIDSKIDYGV